MKYTIHFECEFLTHPYPGKFIALEGLDGSGKTTHASILSDQLGKAGYLSHYTKEPTDLPTGKMIRQVLSGEITMTPVGLQYLFNADRAEHQKEITDYLKKGAYVISDRYFWSSVAYAISDMDKVDDFYLTAFSMLSFYNRFLKPDLTLFLNVSPRVGSQRIAAMGKKREIYDHEAKLVKIQKGYDFLLKRFPREFVTIDAEKPVETVTREIREKVLAVV